MRALLYGGGAAFYFWVVSSQRDTAPGPGKQATAALLGLYFLAIALGSYLPEDRGGYAVRSAARWLAIPLFVGLALFFVEIYQDAGSQRVLGVVFFMAVVMIISWVIRQRGSR
jgi:hypothetical protein